MSLNTTFPDTEEDVRKERKTKLEPFLVLLKEGNFSEAKTLADNLKDIPPTSINSYAFNYVRDLIRQNLKEAIRVTTCFNEQPYAWHCWLPKSNTTKFKKEPNYD